MRFMGLSLVSIDEQEPFIISGPEPSVDLKGCAACGFNASFRLSNRADDFEDSSAGDSPARVYGGFFENEIAALRLCRS